MVLRICSLRFRAIGDSGQEHQLLGERKGPNQSVSAWKRDVSRETCSDGRGEQARTRKCQESVNPDATLARFAQWRLSRVLRTSASTCWESADDEVDPLVPVNTPCLGVLRRTRVAVE